MFHCWFVTPGSSFEACIDLNHQEAQSRAVASQIEPVFIG